MPGYAAPQDTIGPASRPVWVLVAILRDGVERDVLDRRRTGCPAPSATIWRRSSRTPQFAGLPPAVLARGITAWAQLFGTLSFELFGRLTNAVTDYDAYFDYQLRAMAGYLGLP